MSATTNIQDIAQGKYIHWSAYCSLYSGKTRAYLIKKGIEFVEINPSHPYYTETVQAKVGYWAVPILETAAGDIVQDSTEIIEYLEERHPTPSMLPQEKSLQALAWLLCNYGTDGQYNAAMHYRWGFKESNYDFIIDEFTRSLTTPDVREKPEAKSVGIDFAKDMDAYLLRLGVNEDTIPAIEECTEELFKLLDQHFRRYPYLLGGRPSIADCGMMTALFAHIGRDPYPAMKMKELAPALYRWTETMNRPGVIDPEIWHIAPEFFKFDAIPDTLTAILRLIFSNFGEELEANCNAYKGWLETDLNRAAGSRVGYGDEKTMHQELGEITYQYQGVTVTRAGWPDILLTHQRVLAVVAEMSETEQSAYEEFITRAGGAKILALDLPRSLTRNNYTIVLGD